MIGTSVAKYPTQINFLFICSNARIALAFVFLPIPISITNKEKPNVSAKIKYTRIKIPPPYWAAKYGKRHRFPKPTALPAAARTNPSPPLKLLLSSFININNSVSSINKIKVLT